MAEKRLPITAKEWSDMLDSLTKSDISRPIDFLLKHFRIKGPLE
jgi:hypothetical protein